MRKHRNIINERFGRWAVLELLGSDDKGHSICRCRCDCGETRVTRASSLLSGSSVSCGCQRADSAAKQGKKNTTHGQSRRSGKTSAYTRWKSMMQRCYDQNCRAFPDYGGRGIGVHELWHDFSVYFAATGEPPLGLTLDRIDNDGNYEPGNWRWATKSEQAHNRRPKKKR